MAEEKKKIYYGWFIVAAGFAIMSVAWGAVYNTAGLFIQPVGDDLGFTRSQINATMTIRASAQMAVSFLAGKIFRRFNMLRLMKIATVVLVITFFSFSLAQTLAQIYLITVVTSFATSLVAILPLSIILSNWFVQNQGTAIGLAFMGSGAGGMILSSLTGYWISVYGWRSAYQMQAVIIAAVLIPAVFLVIRIHPRELGLIAPGAGEVRRSADGSTDGVRLREAVRTTRFWVLAVATVFMLIAINGVLMNISPHLTDLGYSIRFSANIVALTMGSLAVGKLLLGRFFDRLGVKRAVIIANLAVILSLAGLVYARYVPALAVVIVFAGIGSAYATIANPVLTRELFGRRDYNAIFGFLAAIGSIGSVAGPLLYGWIYDLSGSYILSYQLSLILCLITLPAYLYVFRKDRGLSAGRPLKNPSLPKKADEKMDPHVALNSLK